jgi:hypothetical protein
MRTRLVVALVAALFAFFGWSSRARAAEPTSGPAKPGTYAARHGAPYCDERAASVHAAEPSAPVVDGGEMSNGGAGGDAAAAPKGECSRAASMSVAPPSHDDGDDLQRPPPTARAATLIPTLPEVQPVLMTAMPKWPEARGGPREGVRRAVEAPPRPMPWRR